MTCLDDITKGTSSFNYAIRHAHKSGTAFEIMRPRTPRLLTAWAWAVLPHLIGVALFLMVVGFLCGGVQP